MIENQMFETEEDITNKLLLPLLENLAIEKNELSYEHNFSLRLGKGVYNVKSNSLKNNAQGRADILCKRGNDNLFIVEVKSDKHTIDENDIDQGISYARLVHPIAPIVIVTNGIETKIFDTLTKNEVVGNNCVSTKFWKDGCQITLQDELNYKYEALKNFIGYSNDNLKGFSSSQVEINMQPLKGNATDRNKKYIPELFIQKEDLFIQFNNFLQSNKTCFSIIGESGVGKTNSMCGLAEAFLSENIVLFYNGTFLVNKILEKIESDFNWVFSQNLDVIEIIRKLDNLNEKIKKKICIFIDAIDEVKLENFHLDLNDLIQRLQDFPNIKVIVSCKQTEWNNFLSIDGIPTHTSESIFSTSNSNVSYLLERFDDDFLAKLELSYQEFYKFNGVLTKHLNQETSLGIMLRVISELYENKDLPETINTLEIFQKYFDLKLEKIDKERALNFLQKLGEYIIQQDEEFDFNKMSGFVDEQEFRKFINLSPSESLLPQLFSHNILIRIPDSNNISKIGFYYERLRDYIIAFIALRLNTLDNKEFENIIGDIMKGKIGQNVIYFYLTVSSFNHKNIINNYYLAKAYEFINDYNFIINNHFSKIKLRFQPHTFGEIGLLVDKIEDPTFVTYAFIPIDKNENKIQIDKNIHKISMSQEEMSKKNISSIKTTRFNFVTTNNKASILTEIENQINSFIVERILNEENNQMLLKEYLLALIYVARKNLGYNDFQDIIIPRYQNILPINFDKIRSQITFNLAYLYIEEKKIHEQLKEQNYQDVKLYYLIHKRIGGLVYINTEDINKEALEILNNDYNFLNKHIHLLPKIQQKILEFSTWFTSQKIDIIEPVLPQPDIELEKIYQNPRYFNNGFGYGPNLKLANYSEEQIKKYLESFFSIFLNEYKVFVETNFPTLKENFLIYSILPVKIIVSANTNESFHSWGGLSYYIFKDIEENENIVEVHLNNHELIVNRLNCVYSSSSFLTKFFYAENLGKMDNGIRVDEITPLRSFLYEIIKDEFKSALPQIKETLLTSITTKEKKS